MATIVAWIALHVLLVVVLVGGRLLRHGGTASARVSEQGVRILFGFALLTASLCFVPTLVSGVPLGSGTRQLLGPDEYAAWSTWTRLWLIAFFSVLASLLVTLSVLIALVVLWIRHSLPLGSLVHMTVSALLLLACDLFSYWLLAGPLLADA